MADVVWNRACGARQMRQEVCENVHSATSETNEYTGTRSSSTLNKVRYNLVDEVANHFIEVFLEDVGSRDSSLYLVLRYSGVLVIVLVIVLVTKFRLFLCRHPLHKPI